VNRVTLWNVGGLIAVMALSTAIVWVPALRRSRSSPEEALPALAVAAELVDHAGVRVPRAEFTRIVSLSSLADELLLDLCEPDRVVAFTSYSTRTHARRYRFHGKPTVEGTEEFEKVLTLHPDLILVSRLGDARPVARMREAGLVVYDLGEMHGLETLVPNIREVAALLGHPERGEEMVATLTARMEAVAADVPRAARRRGLYLGVYGGHLYGGAAGTSFHDVLAAAGLLEAAGAYREWPEYTPEQLLAIDPEVIVTHDGMRARICEHAGLGSLRACAAPAGVVTVDDALLDDPGPAMLEAAERVRAAVYGPVAPP